MNDPNVGERVHTWGCFRQYSMRGVRWYRWYVKRRTDFTWVCGGAPGDRTADRKATGRATGRATRDERADARAAMTNDGSVKDEWQTDHGAATTTPVNGPATGSRWTNRQTREREE